MKKKETELVKTLLEDFEQRRRQRMPLELQWRLNSHFLTGQQYCDIDPAAGRLIEDERQFLWQQREVFNHIAPLMESRLSKLSRLKPLLSVRSATTDSSDIGKARICTGILRSAMQKVGLQEKVRAATAWSEICGTAFYKVTWDTASNADGEVLVTVCSPYEIFPDNLAADSVEKLRSLIHAKVVTAEEIELQWGVKVIGGDLPVFHLPAMGQPLPGQTLHTLCDAVLLLEYYEAPTKAHPQGRLVILAGDTLLHQGPLPYALSSFPFVRQTATEKPGSFFGQSVIERCIPIQRAYNAVKNRKHEFLNRAAVGVLAVEDGAMDVEELQEDGLSPGKILIYRQGATPPHLLDYTHIPTEFAREEAQLLQEFMLVANVSEFSRTSSAPSGVRSGIALQTLQEIDDTRLSLTGENIRTAVSQVGKHMLKLYRQFASARRTEKILGDKGHVLSFYWNASDITADDVLHETENELSYSLSQRREMVMQLLAAGLLQDPQTGKLDTAMRQKVLQMLEMGNWESALELYDLHALRAQRENQQCALHAPLLRQIDDHAIHIAEHEKFILGGEYEALEADNKEAASGLQAHLLAHKAVLASQVDKGTVLLSNA